MEFSEENCLIVSNLFDKNNDDDKVYEFFMSLINKYYNMYDKLENLKITDKFKLDTKNIFELAKKIFCKEDIVNELGDENDKNYDKSEYNEYLEMIENINYVNKNLNILDDDNCDEFKNKILSVWLFFWNKENDLNMLNEAIEDLKDSLSNFKNHYNL